MNHLFFFTIGPVQGFIAQARKTHDLFAGSSLLSELSHTAINTFLQESKPFGGEIILPYTTAADDKIPNRFVGKLQCDENQIIESIGKKTEQAVRDKLDLIAMAIFSDQDLKMLPSVLSIAMAQVKNLPEIYWLSVPMKDPKEYQTTYNHGEKMMGAIKNLRAFEQIQPGGEVGRKCIVDGERNVVLYRKAPKESNTTIKLHYKSDDELNDHVLVLEANDEKQEKIYNLGNGEGISTVTYLKRKHLRDPHKFPSTAGIALKHIRKNQPVLYQEYEDLTKQKLGHTNDQLYYRENLNERGLKDTNIKEADIQDVLKTLKKKLEELEKAAGDLPFLKYYALISFDGDNMGEWFSGANLVSKDNLETFHRRLSEQLHHFAIAASAYLDQFGKTVYAGEDFLGFINLTYLFEVIKELRLLWNCHVQQELEKDFRFESGKQLTFSAGIVIAHHKAPLGFALKRVREAAREAKEGVDGTKNRFCMVAMKHSGSELECAYPFEGAALSDIEHLHDAIANDFSAAFISKYNQLLAHLGKETSPDFVKAELKNFIKRACNLDRNEGETVDDYQDRKIALRKKLTDAIDRLIDLNTTTDNNATQLGRISNLTGTLAICDFIERKTK
jgi:CRISPR-associated protein Cmr2